MIATPHVPCAIGRFNLQFVTRTCISIIRAVIYGVAVFTLHKNTFWTLLWNHISHHFNSSVRPNMEPCVLLFSDDVSGVPCFYIAPFRTHGHDIRSVATKSRVEMQLSHDYVHVFRSDQYARLGNFFNLVH